MEGVSLPFKEHPERKYHEGESRGH